MKSSESGVARYSRKCPKCGNYIFTGNKIARQKVGKRIVWVHESCYIPARLEKEVKKLDTEFKRVIDH